MKISRMVATLAAAVAVSLPLALASPAEASTTIGRCTVTPLQPAVVGIAANGQKIARYRVDIKCDSNSLTNRAVKVRQEVYEDDNGKPGDVGGDDLLTSREWGVINVPSSGGSYYWYLERAVPDWDAPDDWVEMYHRVRFSVTSGDLVQQSSWENSPVRNVLV